MKLRQILTLTLSILTLFTTLACAQNELIPTAQAQYTLEDGTILDPGSHGLVIEDIDTRLLTSKSEILKVIKDRGNDEEDYELYKDYSFWEVSITVKNNFPVDIYGLNMMLYSMDAEYRYNEQWWESIGKTVGFASKDYENYLPDGFGPGEIMMKPGESYTHTFYYYNSKYAFNSEHGTYPKFLFVDWYEFWTKDECVMDQTPQISPYVELDGYQNAAKKHGVSVKSKNPSSASSSYGLEVTGIEFIPADLGEAVYNGEIRVGRHSIRPDDISKEDMLLEMRITLKNNSDKDIEDPQLDFLLYNKDGDMVYRDEYSCNGNILVGKEATISAGYYYSEDPYYIPHSVKETYGTRVFETPVPIYTSLNLSIKPNSIAAGNYHTVYIRSDGTVGAVGRTDYDRCKVEDWTDIIAVDASSHTVGLKSDGTVVATGLNSKKQCNVSDWKDIVAIAVGDEHTVGLKSDGTVIAVGNSANKRLDTQAWTGIIAIAAGGKTTYGLKYDGTVIATGSNAHGQTNLTKWDDVVAIAAGNTHVLGLTSEDIVLSAGSDNFDEQCVSRFVNPLWRSDIAAIIAGNQTTYGLRADGTVIATGNNKYGQCDVSDWTDIVAISAGMHHVIGIRADGSYITAGSNAYGQCDLE